LGFDGLGQIGIRADFQTLNPIRRADPRGRDLQDHRFGAGSIILDLAADFETADIGQLDVEQHQLRPELLDDPKRLGAGAGLQHVIAGALQDAGLGVTPGFVVVDI
jgi:hypothetical protein